MSRVEQLKKLVELSPGDPLAHYGLGLEYINQQNWEEAIAAFDRALQHDSKYSVAYYHKGRAEIGAGRLDAARVTLRKGIEVAGSAGDWHAQRETQELLDSIS